jgi:4-hydroxy-tetrahydrodipicolinate reductase
MGTSILRLVKDDADITVAGAVEAAGKPDPGEGIRIERDLAGVIGNGDVVIDFTTPAATLEHLAVAVERRKPMVIGTTGFSDAEIGRIKEAARAIPVVFTPNMSVGVNILFRLAGEVAKTVPGYDMEIVELHHNQKKDAPSGTALKISRIIAESLGRNIDAVGVYGREGIIGPRRKEEIGVLAVRAGDIVGEHTVYFAGPGERIELTHRAHSRDPLAAGAITAAKWLASQKPGLYDMQDVLGFNK